MSFMRSARLRKGPRWAGDIDKARSDIGKSQTEPFFRKMDSHVFVNTIEADALFFRTPTNGWTELLGLSVKRDMTSTTVTRPANILGGMGANIVLYCESDADCVPRSKSSGEIT